MKHGFAAWFSSFIEGSAICRGFGRFGNFLYKKIGSGLYSFLFGSYDAMCDTFDASRIGGALGLSRVLGYTGVCFSSPLAWIGATALLIPFYRREMRKGKNIAA